MKPTWTMRLLVALATGIVSSIGGALGGIAAEAIRERYMPPDEEPVAKRKKVNRRKGDRR